MTSRSPHRQTALRTRFSGIFSSPRVLTMGNDTVTDQSKPSRERSVLGPSLGSDPSAPSSPTKNDKNDKNDGNDKPHRLSLRKARKLSRVFTDFSLLDSFTSQKSVDDLKAQRYTPQRPSTSYGRAHETSFDGRCAQSLDGRPPQLAPSASLPVRPGPKTASSTTIFATPRTSAERTPQSPRLPNTPTIPHNALTSHPEDIPLPPSRPGSSRGGTVLLKRHRKSLELRSLDEFGFIASLSTRSKSLRIPSTSGSSRPTTPKVPTSGRESSPDVRDPPKTPHHHYVEVKRARKMTQLFGQELPPELIRVLDDRRNAERTRPRANSTTSSLLDSDPVLPTLAVENETDPVENENMVPHASLETLHDEFQERRRRVTKLTQFFGVNHAEIASSLVFTKPNDSRSTPLGDTTHQPPPIPYEEPVEVGVRVVSRRRWGLGENMRDVELSDAINELRCLKAS